MSSLIKKALAAIPSVSMISLAMLPFVSAESHDQLRKFLENIQVVRDPGVPVAQLNSYRGLIVLFGVFFTFWFAKHLANHMSEKAAFKISIVLSIILVIIGFLYIGGLR